MDIADLSFRVDSSPVRQGDRDLERFGKTSAKSASLVERASASVRNSIKKQAASLVGMAAASFAVGQAVSTIANFELSMARLGAVSRATEAELIQLRDVAKTLGSTTEFSASQAASGLNFLAMAGFSAAEGMAAIPSVLDLATAATLDLGNAADISSNIMSAFGIAAKDAADVADVLAAASSRANTDVGQLGEAMKFVGPVASALGIEMNDAAAAIGVLSDAGIQGGMAGTGLRRVLSSLANPTKEAADVIRGLGLELTDLNPATTSIVEIVGRLEQAGLDAAQALTIFGDRGGPAILALTSQTGSLRELTGELSDVEGEAKRMADTMRDNLSGDLKGVSSATEGLILALGDAGLTEVLRAGAQELIAFIRGTSLVISQIGDAIRAYRTFTDVGYALENTIRDQTAAMQESVRGIGEVSTGLALSNVTSAAAARIKLTEAEAIRDKIAAMVDERAEMARGTEAYREIQSAIAQTSENLNMLRENAGRDGGVFAPDADRAAFEQQIGLLQKQIDKRREILGLASDESREVDGLTDRINQTRAAIEAAASGQSDFNGKTLDGSTFAERLAQAMGNVTINADAGSRAAGGLASSIAGANAQATSLIANLGRVPAAMAGLAATVVDASESMKLQNAALRDQITNGTDARVASLKAERNAILNRMEIEGLDMAQASQQVAVLDRKIAQTADLAAENNALSTTLSEQAAAATKAAASIGGSGGGGGGSLAKAAKAAIDPMKDLNEEAEKSTPLIDSLSNAWGDFVVSGFRDFKGMVDSIKGAFTNMLSSMIAQAARNRIIMSFGASGGLGGAASQAVAGGLPGAPGPLGGLGSLVGGGGIFSSLLGSFGSGGSILGVGGLGGGAGLLGGLGNAVSGGLGNILSIGSNAALAGGGLLAGIGAALPVIGIAAAVFSFFKTKKKLIDSGIQGVITMEDSMFETYRKVEKSRFFGLSKSRSTKRKRIGGSDGEALSLAVDDVQSGVLDSAAALGVAVDAFEGFRFKFKLSTKKLSEEAQQEAISAQFEKMADSMAGMIDGLRDVSERGESYSETLTRLATSLTAVNSAMGDLGLKAYDISVAGGAAASAFVQLFGGLEAFATASSTYYQNFYTDAERVARATSLLNAEMLALGLDGLPASRAAFRALVDEADQMGDTDLVAGLIGLSGAFAEVTGATATLRQGLSDLANEDFYRTGVEFLRGQSRAANGLEYRGEQTQDEMRLELKAMNERMARLLSASEITAANTGKSADTAEDQLAITLEQTI